jgi:hypothetical protein
MSGGSQPQVICQHLHLTSSPHPQVALAEAMAYSMAVYASKITWKVGAPCSMCVQCVLAGRYLHLWNLGHGKLLGLSSPPSIQTKLPKKAVASRHGLPTHSAVVLAQLWMRLPTADGAAVTQVTHSPGFTQIPWSAACNVNSRLPEQLCAEMRARTTTTTTTRSRETTRKVARACTVSPACLNEHHQFL